MSGERGNELRRVYPFVGGHGISFLHCPPSEGTKLYRFLTLVHQNANLYRVP
jgi:hypothetical protein